MNQTPFNWVEVNLGEVTEVVSGIGFPNEYQGNISGDLPFYKVSDISQACLNNYGVLNKANNYVSFDVAKILKGKLIENNATVFAKIGEAVRLNRRALVSVPCLVDNNVMAVKAIGDISDKYIYYFLRNVDFSQTTRSTTVPSLRKGDVEELELPLAPLNEQCRIADKLDATLARVDALNDRLARITPLLKRFRQSVLAAATSGRLTEDWRHDHLAGEWINKKLGDICKITSGFAFKSTEFVESGITAVKISNIQYGEFEIKNQEYLPFSYINEYERFVVKPGDLLLALTRPITNGQLKVCKFPISISKGLLNQRVCKIACGDDNLNKYLHIYMQSDLFLKLVNDGLTETLQPNLSPRDLAEFRVQLPTEEEQTEIVRRVETLFAFADRLEARLQTAQTAAERLTPSLLAKAFRGELVPQDPNDEPATELLRRLREARAAQVPTKKPRKITTARA